MNESIIKESVLKVDQAPVLPLKNMVMFPNVILPLFVARPFSKKIIEDSQNSDIIFVAQKNYVEEEPKPEDLYEIGTLCKVIHCVNLADGAMKIMIEGIKRVKILDYTQTEPFFKANFIELDDIDVKNAKNTSLFRALNKSFEKYIKQIEKNPVDLISTINNTEDQIQGTHLISGHLSLKSEEKQNILEELSTHERLNRLLEVIELELQILQMEKKIRNNIKEQVEKNQRDYLLQEQIKAIQKELNDGEEDPVDTLQKKLAKISMPSTVKDKVKGEIKKLKFMNAMSSEASIIKSWIDVVLELPWKKFAVVNKDFDKSKQILDEDHYGLEKLKERIYELLAVQLRVKKTKSSIMCLFGPPGVGKTSIVKSIAKAMGRPFVRIALGGLHDEAEIRGHRKTYIGSMPGKIIQAIKKARVSNPVILLDEIGKVGYDIKGDPAAALLEVLDPEQNHAFQDNYLEVGYDLSDILFIATTNSLNLPHALVDRLEVIRVSGYTEMEKVQIAERHLIPKQKKLHGLTDDELKFSTESIHELIAKYTREAGVRSLEREIANISRKSVKLIESKKKKSIHVSKPGLQKLIGIEKYSDDKAELGDRVGVCTGLAWTEMGGDILYIESSVFPGTGKTLSTGKLGDVMKESVQAAMTFIKSRAKQYGIDSEIFNKTDVHVHVPEGATPKDGPSAGVAICCSLLSSFTKRPIISSLAMTGEISLRGRVLPIGGVKEKVLAAHRSGVKNVILPTKNKKDIEEIPNYVRKNINIEFCEYVEDVLDKAIRPSA